MNIKDNLYVESSTSREKVILNSLIQFYIEWETNCKDDKEVEILKVRNFLLVPIVKAYDSTNVLGQGFYYYESIFKSATMLLTTIAKWQALNEGCKKVFESYAKSELNSIDSLMEAIDYFKNKTKSSFWV